MKRIVLLFLLMLLELSAAGQSASYEVIAYEYFLEVIVPKMYPNGISFTFVDKTRKEFTSFELNDNCFQKDDYTFKLKLDSAAINAAKRFSDELKIKSSVRQSLVRRSSQTKLWLFKATELDGLFYVELRLVERTEGQVSYFLEISKSGEVLRNCFASQIY